MFTSLAKDAESVRLKLRMTASLLHSLYCTVIIGQTPVHRTGTTVVLGLKIMTAKGNKGLFSRLILKMTGIMNRACKEVLQRRLIDDDGGQTYRN